jgi:hypothetical protein
MHRGDGQNSHLWTYAIRAANDSRNYSPTNEQDTCPISRFCSTSSLPSIQNQHHFECPTYVLRKKLQDRKKIGKWSDRTRVGINLGYSSKHALNVHLSLIYKLCHHNIIVFMMTYLKLLQEHKADPYLHHNGNTKQVLPWISQKMRIRILKMMSKSNQVIQKRITTHHKRVRITQMMKKMDQMKKINQTKHI